MTEAPKKRGEIRCGFDNQPGDTGERILKIRRYSSTVEAKGENERELIGLTGTVPFDDRYNQRANVNDLSVRLMTDFLGEVGSRLGEETTDLSSEALGRQMNVVSGPIETPLPRNVGLLFFNEEPRQYFPATQIDVVYLRRKSLWGPSLRSPALRSLSSSVTT